MTYFTRNLRWNGSRFYLPDGILDVAKEYSGDLRLNDLVEALNWIPSKRLAKATYSVRSSDISSIGFARTLDAAIRDSDLNADLWPLLLLVRAQVWVRGLVYNVVYSATFKVQYVNSSFSMDKFKLKFPHIAGAVSAFSRACEEYVRSTPGSTTKVNEERIISFAHGIVSDFLESLDIVKDRSFIRDEDRLAKLCGRGLIVGSIRQVLNGIALKNYGLK